MKPRISFQPEKLETTVLVSGKFNVIHPGHLRLFRFAKECGDRLVVAVESDVIAGDDAHVPQDYRLEGVLSNSYVDHAFLFDQPIESLIAELQPAVVVKGKEHETKMNAEYDAVAGYGGRLLFSSGDAIFSSMDLLRRESSHSNAKDIFLPPDYLCRHRITRPDMVRTVRKFSDLRVIVIGDLIVDEYVTCQALGMSQEDPAIVVTPLDRQQFIGGAGIVAAHAAGLGSNVSFCSITGGDTPAIFCSEKLQEFRVKSHLLNDCTRPTTLKQRFRSKGKTLLRVNHLHHESISLELQRKLFKKLKEQIPHADLLVFSDFNYGCLPQALVDKLCDLARSHGVMMVADSQSSSQIGNVGRFRQMDILTPTEREARISTRSHEDGLVVLAESLRTQADAKNILLKMGEEGLLIHAGGEQPGVFMTDRLLALNNHPKDVAGAGDSLLIVGAMAMAAGASIWESALLGSIAAAIQVGRVGNTPITCDELIGEIGT